MIETLEIKKLLLLELMARMHRGSIRARRFISKGVDQFIGNVLEFVSVGWHMLLRLIIR